MSWKSGIGETRWLLHVNNFFKMSIDVPNIKVLASVRVVCCKVRIQMRSRSTGNLCSCKNQFSTRISPILT
jgi:hypothetical protein